MSLEPLHTDDPEDFDLSKLAPGLSSLKKQELFKAPEGYFDDLPGRIHAQVRTPKAEPFSLKSLFGRIFSREGAAALAMCMILIAAGVWMFQGNTITDTDFSERFASLSNEELMSAIDVGDMSDQELLDVFGEQSLPEFTEEADPVETVDPGATQDEKEGVDFSDIETDDLMDFYF